MYIRNSLDERKKDIILNVGRDHFGPKVGMKLGMLFILQNNIKREMILFFP